MNAHINPILTPDLVTDLRKCTCCEAEEDEHVIIERLENDCFIVEKHSTSPVHKSLALQVSQSCAQLMGIQNQ